MKQKKRRHTIQHGEFGPRYFYTPVRSSEEMVENSNDPRPSDEELRKSIEAAEGNAEEASEPETPKEEAPPAVNAVAAPVPPQPVASPTPPPAATTAPGVSVVDVSNVAAVVSPQAHQQAAKQVDSMCFVLPFSEALDLFFSVM